jgi:hypothetical protein
VNWPSGTRRQPGVKPTSLIDSSHCQLEWPLIRISETTGRNPCPHRRRHRRLAWIEQGDHANQRGTLLKDSDRKTHDPSRRDQSIPERGSSRKALRCADNARHRCGPQTST